MVDRRWAITIDVRPRMSSAMPRSMTRSVSGSTLAVASSRIRISGSRARARAKATSWRSPAEKFAPRSTTGASRPSGRVRDDAVGAHAARGLEDPLVRDPGIAEADVVAQRAGEHEDVLADHDDAAAQRLGIKLAAVDAADADDAGQRCRRGAAAA